MVGGESIVVGEILGGRWGSGGSIGRIISVDRGGRRVVGGESIAVGEILGGRRGSPSRGIRRSCPFPNYVYGPFYDTPASLDSIWESAISYRVPFTPNILYDRSGALSKD